MKAGLKRFLSSILVLALVISSIFTDTGVAFAAKSSAVTSKNGSETKELIVHFKSPWEDANIFYWNLNGQYNNPVKWPGDSMSPTKDGWYSYIIEDVDSANIMFTHDGKMTKDFDKAWADYMKVCKLNAKKFFTEIIDECDLLSPFVDGNIEKIVAELETMI